MSAAKLRGFLDCETAPMSHTETDTMMRLMVGSQTQPFPEELHAELSGLRSTYFLVFRRLEWAGCVASIDREVIVFVSTLSGLPGELVQWALTLAVIAHEKGRCGWDEFVHAFPSGLPIKAARCAAWDAQKGERGNRIDDLSEWPQRAEVAA